MQFTLLKRKPLLAIIGGSGLDSLDGFSVESSLTTHTPYGAPSGQIQKGRFISGDGTQSSVCLFLPRHAPDHSIAPHCINYRANIYALKQAGATQVIGVCAVGGITDDYLTGVLSVPNQLIDYTWGREHSFFDEGVVKHIPFADPFSQTMREQLLNAGLISGQKVVDGGVYGVTQGPRLETSAEIQRMKRDGCDVVGMTAMPEAGLARELGLEYACLCLTVNPASGVAEVELTLDEIYAQIEAGVPKITALLKACVAL